MEKIKVSIIVPVYNVEKYIRRCLDTLICQTLEEIEIILVDDASTDASGIICDEYAKRDYRIKVIHQETNMGQSHARNVALDICTGEYITYVDSDDWVSNNMCEMMYMHATESGAKMTIFDYTIVNVSLVQEKKGFLGDDLNRNNYFKYLTPGYLWNKIFHSSLKSYMKIDVHSGQAEDLCMLLILVSNLKADSDIHYVSESYYFYMWRNDSASNSRFFVKSYGIEDYFKSLKYIIDNHNPAFTKWAIYYCVQCLYWGIDNPDRKCFKADYIEFLQKEIYPYIIGNATLKRYTFLMRDLLQELIPKRIVYANFSSSELKESELWCIGSWKKYAKGYDFIYLNEENCSIESAPQIVRKAYEERKYSFVADYFKLKEIYLNGGIAVSTNIFINMPLGEQRTHRTFFGYRNHHELGTDIWGSIKNEAVLDKLLKTYEEDSLYNDTFLPLCDRVQVLLEREYKLVPKGKECFLLRDVIKLYGSNTLYKRLDVGNVSQLYSKFDRLLADENKLIVDYEDVDSLRNSLNTSRETANLMQMRTEINNLAKEVQLREERSMQYETAYNQTINSTCWKLTKPLRKILDLVRRNGKHE